jgi:hypothetical protein
MKIKTIIDAVEIKFGGTALGQATTIFSQFNVIDRDGEVTLPGAITDEFTVRASSYNDASSRISTASESSPRGGKVGSNRRRNMDGSRRLASSAPKKLCRRAVVEDKSWPVVELVLDGKRQPR